jgi:CBS domain-containing protein
MRQERVSSVLLLEQEHLFGIVTDRDLRNRAVAAGLDPASPVLEIATVAPLTVEVPVRSNGHARRLTVIRAQDFTGAWERKILTPVAPVPERMLFDLRGLSGYRPGVSLGP